MPIGIWEPRTAQDVLGRQLQHEGKTVCEQGFRDSGLGNHREAA